MTTLEYLTALAADYLPDTEVREVDGERVAVTWPDGERDAVTVGELLRAAADMSDEHIDQRAVTRP